MKVASKMLQPFVPELQTVRVQPSPVTGYMQYSASAPNAGRRMLSGSS